LSSPTSLAARSKICHAAFQLQTKQRIPQPREAVTIAILPPPLLWTKTAQQPATTCRHLHHQPPATDHSSANTYTNNTTFSTGEKEKA
jgi:hypothetical protein